MNSNENDSSTFNICTVCGDKVTAPAIAHPSCSHWSRTGRFLDSTEQEENSPTYSLEGGAIALISCPACGTAVSNQANACPKCGQPTTIAPPRSFKGLPQTRYDIVCPKCLLQNSLSTDLAKSLHKLTCSGCQSSFQTRIAKIRSKNSRHITKARQRLFKVRVMDFPEGESYIEFYAKGEEDFELRQRDLASFQYFKDKIVVVQNHTTSKYLDLSRAKHSWSYAGMKDRVASFQPVKTVDSYQESQKTKSAYRTGCSTLCMGVIIIAVVIAAGLLTMTDAPAMSLER